LDVGWDETLKVWPNPPAKDYSVDNTAGRFGRVSCWVLALVVATSIPAARVAAVNIGFMGVTQGPIELAHRPTFSQKSDRTMMLSCENRGDRLIKAPGAPRVRHP
jgi:hypothetical protein